MRVRTLPLDSRALVVLPDRLAARNPLGHIRSQRAVAWAGRISALDIGHRLAAGRPPLLGLMAYAVRGQSSSILAPSVYRGREQPPVRGFDFRRWTLANRPPSSWMSWPGTTSARPFFNVEPTFAGFPTSREKSSEAGHEIGNHSDTHPFFHFNRRRLFTPNWPQPRQSIYRAAGTLPRFFRAPFGVRWFGLREVQKRLGLLGVMWTAIGVDWR